MSVFVRSSVAHIIYGTYFNLVDYKRRALPFCSLQSHDFLPKGLPIRSILERPVKAGFWVNWDENSCFCGMHWVVSHFHLSLRPVNSLPIGPGPSPRSAGPSNMQLGELEMIIFPAGICKELQISVECNTTMSRPHLTGSIQRRAFA